MVVAQEIAATNEKGEDVFDEKKAACWYLLTSGPETTIDEAIFVVQFYALRWRIERFHFTLKSGGYHVEKLQFDDLQTTINVITFYSIAAWELLRLTYLVRQQHDQPATVCYDEQEIELLQKVSKKKVVTITDAVLALAELIGFVRSKKQPLPSGMALPQAILVKRYIDVQIATPEGLTEQKMIQISFEFEQIVTDILSKKIQRAVEQKGAQMVILAGGVSANSTLKNKIQKISDTIQVPFLSPKKPIYSMDNAAMVGIRAYYQYQKNI